MIKFTYIEDTEELLTEIGISEKEFWEYLSLDDWDYALVFDGHLPPNKRPYNAKEMLRGCNSNEWQYLPKQNKTVGMAYHA